MRILQLATAPGDIATVVACALPDIQGWDVLEHSLPKSWRIRARALLLRSSSIVLLCLFLPPAAMGQAVGAIGGTVQDATGGALPGVTVTLSNPGVIGGNQQTVTDARGAYQFARLVPGSTYAVRAELSGFRAAASSGIVVNADVTTRLDLTLQVGDVQETVTVSGASPLVDTTAVLRQTVMETETLGKLPTGRDLWTAVRLVPGVVVVQGGGGTGGGYDVGGTGSLLQSAAIVHGSQLGENRYFVDGMNVTQDASPGLAGSYFDTSMFQELNVQTGNAQAEVEWGGVRYNMVTKTGNNVVHGSLSYTGTHHALQANNVTPDLRQQLLAAVPARVLQANPNLEPSPKILTFYNLEGSVTGPILRDRLWFTASANTKPLEQYRLGSYNPDGTQLLDDNLQRNYGFKLSWQATPRNQLHYVRQTSHRTAYHRLTAGDLTASFESRATHIQELAYTVDTLKWTSALSNRLVMQISGGGYYGHANSLEQPGVQQGDVPRLDVVTNTYGVAVATYSKLPLGHIDVSASLAYVAGKHELKVGYQPSYQWYKSNTWSTSHYPSGLLAVFRNGVPDSVRTYNTPVESQSYARDHGMFVQDQWRATGKLTLNMGLRLQKTDGWVSPQCQVQTIFIVQDACFPRINDLPNWFDLAPRFGLIYDIRGDGKTALKLAANRYTHSAGPSHPLRVNPLRVGNDTRLWTDLNGDQIPQLTELGPSTGFNIGTTSRYDPDLKRPYTNELNVAIEQQLPGNMAAAVGYYYRQTLRNLGSRNVAVPLESYIPLAVTERVSGQQVTVYNQDPATRGRLDILIDNFSEMNTDFHGVDLTVTKRLSNRWMIMGGLALGENTGDTYSSTADLNNPNFTFRRGLVQADVPVSFKLSGIYQLPYDFSLGGNVQYSSGYVESDTVVVTRDTAILTQVTQAVRIAPQGTNRLPSVTLIDLALRRAFKIHGGISVEPAVEVFNIANADTVTSRSAQLGPVYHRVAGILSGRLVRFGFDVKF